MSTGRSYGIAGLLVAAGLALAGCAPAQGAPAQGGVAQPAKVATLRTPPDGKPDIITLAAAAVERLGVTTEPVTTATGGTTIPYGALVYQADGSAWVFVQTVALSYQRAPVKVAGVKGDRVTLTSGPPVGTEVVAVGAAELVGVEIGIDGEQ
jgi:hypothetical protein